MADLRACVRFPCSTIRHSNDWYKSSRMNSPLNIGTSAYAQLLRVVSRFHETIYSDPESPTGLNQVRGSVSLQAARACAHSCLQHLDFRTVILEHDEQLTAFFNEWMDRFQRDSDMTGSCFVSEQRVSSRCMTNAHLDPVLKFRAELLPL